MAKLKASRGKRAKRFTPAPEVLLESARRHVLEDVILGTDTNNQKTLAKRAAVWLEANNYGPEALDDYPDDAVGCIADCVGWLSAGDVLEQLEKHLEPAELAKRVAEKLSG